MKEGTVEIYSCNSFNYSNQNNDSVDINRLYENLSMSHMQNEMYKENIEKCGEDVGRNIGGKKTNKFEDDLKNMSNKNSLICSDINSCDVKMNNNSEEIEKQANNVVMSENDCSTNNNNCIGGKASQSMSKRAYMINPILLMRQALQDKCSVDMCKHINNEEYVAFKDYNLCVDSSSSSGLYSRKGDSYSIADIFLLIYTQKSEYTYSLITQCNRKYINVIEKTKVMQYYNESFSTLDEGCLNVINNAKLVSAYALNESFPVRIPYEEKADVPLDGRREGKEAKILNAHLILDRNAELFTLEENPLGGISSPGNETCDTVDTVRLHYNRNEEISSFLNTYETTLRLLTQNSNNKSSAIFNVTNTNSDNKTNNNNNSYNNPDFSKLIYRNILKKERDIFSAQNVLCMKTVTFDKILNKYEEIEKAKAKGESLAPYSHTPTLTQLYGFNKILSKKLKSQALPKQTSKEIFKTYANKIHKTSHDEQQVKRKLCLLDSIIITNHRHPIILISSGLSKYSVVHKFNVADLLIKGKFNANPSDHQEHNKLEQNEPPNTDIRNKNDAFNSIEIVHTIKGKRIKFNIIECTYTSRFSEKDWKSVVCVIINSNKWQFNQWPFDTLVNLFLTFRGIYFMYENDKAPSEILNWNVKIIRISRTYRYNDSLIKSEFWGEIEDFILKNTKHTQQFNFENKLIF